jgi:phage baseplate assembly protein W|tara:strand:- start:3471 stop:3914 length:444 start_codon:yes stop_codon:yes gene_type:complete
MPAKAFSIEDGNLNTSSISTTKSVVYTDLDLFFSPKPSGDVYKKQDVAAVKQSVKNILMTNFMEKPFNPEYGGNLNSFLFELDTTVEADILRDQIFETISLHEPRALMREVFISLDPEKNNIYVTINFQVLNSVEPVSLELSLTRLR